MNKDSKINIDPAARVSAIKAVLKDDNAMAHILYKPELRNERTGLTSSPAALPDSNDSSNNSSRVDPAARMELEAQIGKDNKFKGSGPAWMLLIAFVAFLATIVYIVWQHYNT
jgi:hypothetical protein